MSLKGGMQNEEARGVDSEIKGLPLSGPGKNFGENVIRGIAASPGVALGKVCIHKDIFSHIPVLPIANDQIGNEIGRIQKAVEEIEEAIRRDQKTIRKKFGPQDFSISAMKILATERHKAKRETDLSIAGTPNPFSFEGRGMNILI